MVQAKTTISRNGARAPSAGDSLPALMMAGSAAQRRGISPSVSLRSTAPSSEGAKGTDYIYNSRAHARIEACKQS
nr:MAG TPA_asm: hypothetical protein [Caudoviricetes sp.]